MSLTFTESPSYKNGSWLPFHELTWGVTDLGTTQGALLVERLRTFNGSLFDVEEHLTRFAEGAMKLGIPWPPRGVVMQELCEDLVQRNKALISQEGDVGLVLLLSPGDPGIDRRQTMTPTILGHVVPLPFSQLSGWYKNGAELHISSVRNVPSECWAPSIKTRSRLQYYLAENATHATRTPESIAVLLSIHGYVTETSISNLLVLGKDGVLRSPALKDILWGVSLKTVCQLAESIGQQVEFSDLRPRDMLEANEILMTGTTGGVWSAVSVDGNSIFDARPGSLCERLQAAWHQKIGFNFVEQATHRSG